MIEACYFFLFQSVAINMAYMPVHLRGLGLTGRQISMVFAVAPLLSLMVPLGWAWLADRTHRHDRVLRLVAGGAFLGFTPVLFAGRFGTILGGYLVYALFGVGLGGLIDALAIARVRGGAIYGRIRLWGSIGYVTAAVIGGAILSTARLPAAGALPAIAMWLALGGTFAASLRVTGAGEDAVHPTLAQVRALLAEPRLRLVLLAGALHWICMTPYNVYFSIYLRELGLPPIAAGLGLSVGVVAEMLVLLWFHRLEARFRLETLLGAAFIVSAARWLAVAVVRDPVALIALQVLHGMTFGMFWSAAIALVSSTVPPPLRATGQALLVVSINLGGALGNLTSGWVYDAGGARTLFMLAAVGELAPLAVALRARRRLRS